MRMIKRSSLPLTLGLVLAGAPALAQDTGGGTAPPGSEVAPLNAPGPKGVGQKGQPAQPGQEAHGGAIAGTFSPQDKQFVEQAALDNMFEVKLGQLALEKAQSKTVRDYASRMVKDHSSSMASLSKIAQKQGVELPTKIADEQQSIYDRLSQLSGKEFDTAYMDQVSQDHQSAMSLFQRESEETQDKDLRGYAKSTLSTLHKHQDMAKRDVKKL